MRPVAYYNSEIINREELSIDIRDLGFILGTTISERLRTFGGQLFELDAHLERLRQSLDITQLSPSQSLSELKEAAVSLVNSKRTSPPANAPAHRQTLLPNGKRSLQRKMRFSKFIFYK